MERNLSLSLFSHPLKCRAYHQLFIIHSIEHQQQKQKRCSCTIEVEVEKKALDKARGNCALKVIDENLYVLKTLFLLSFLSFLSFTPVFFPKKKKKNTKIRKKRREKMRSFYKRL